MRQEDFAATTGNFNGEPSLLYEKSFAGFGKVEMTILRQHYHFFIKTKCIYCGKESLFDESTQSWKGCGHNT